MMKIWLWASALVLLSGLAQAQDLAPDSLV